MRRLNRIGQVTVEYFLLLAAIVLVTLIGLTTVDNDISATFQNLFTDVVKKMPLDDGTDSGGGGSGSVPDDDLPSPPPPPEDPLPPIRD